MACARAPRRWHALVALAAAGCASAVLALHVKGSSTPPRAAAAATTTPQGTIAQARHAPRVPRPRLAAQRVLGLPPVPRGPVPGYVLIADRDNGRLLLVSPSKRVVWRFPGSGDVRPGQSFRDPDDAFFTPGYRSVITNEEINETIAQVDLRRRRLTFGYGRAGVAGAGPGELSHPDD